LTRVAVFDLLVTEGMLEPEHAQSYQRYCKRLAALPFLNKISWVPIVARAREIVDASPPQSLTSATLFEAMHDEFPEIEMLDFRAKVCVGLDLIKLDKYSNPLRDWTPILETAASIVRGYTTTAVTLRHLFYKLVTAGIFPNTEDKYYAALGEHVSEARLAGQFPDLIDPSREIEGGWGLNPSEFEMPDVKDELRDAAWSVRWSINKFRRAERQGQHYRIFIGVEKRGLLELIKSWFSDYPVKIVPFGGHSSTTLTLNIRRELDEARRHGEQAVMIYGGDYDPSGLVIPKSFARLTGMDMVRVALNRDQVDEYGLTRGEAKKDDNNRAAMLAEVGEICQVEIEALEPDVLKQLYMDAFHRYWDEAAYSQAREEEREERKRLAEIVEPMAQQILALIPDDDETEDGED
jgi:hypothetical protein